MILSVENIEKLLNGEIEKLPIEYTPIQTIENFFEFNFRVTDFQENQDTNGWQVDFWIYFHIDNQKLCFHGSWYWGNYVITLSK